MNRPTLGDAIEQAERFLKAAKDLQRNGKGLVFDAKSERWVRGAWRGGSDDPKRSGAVRRASMDLTRALAELRKS